MTSTHDTQPEEAWEKGELGASEEYVRKVSTEEEQVLDEALNLQIISIRLQKELIKHLKLLATHEGIGYQPLIWQILTHYAHQHLRGHDPHKRLRSA